MWVIRPESALGWIDGAPDPASTGEESRAAVLGREKAPRDHAPQVSAGCLATGSSRQMLTARIKGKPPGRPRVPQSPRQAGWSQPLQCLFPAASSAVMCLSAPHPLICSYIYTSDSLFSLLHAQMQLFIHLLTGLPITYSFPTPSSYFILYQRL